MLVQVILRPDTVVDIGQGNPRMWHRSSFIDGLLPALAPVQRLHGGLY
jgi:hypothetical protein